MLLLFGSNEIAEANKTYDVAIRHGRIVDGTGAPWYQADVGIRDGLNVHIGRIQDEEAEVVIDATNRIVSPGFIDMMGQTASPLIDDPAAAINLLTQGITTINAGEGVSAAPLSDVDGARKGWTTMAEYFSLVESQGIPINVVQTIGHTQVRQLVIGDVDRRPADEELRSMQTLVQEAMEAGAIGVSTALIYPPAVFAPTEEIAALVETAGQYGGRYYTHMRNEGDKLLEAIDEALEIGRKGRAPVHIFHLKAAGRQNWGKMPLAIARIQAARAAGQQVTADIYPYINNGLGIAALIHPSHFADGYDALIRRLDDAELRQKIRHEMESTDGWENWYRHAGQDWNRMIIGRSNLAKYAEWDGQSVAAIAKQANEDVWDTFFALVKSGAFALPETMTEANKILAMQQPFISFCTDVGPISADRAASHPRAFGSFPRLLSRYVRDLGVLSLEQAVSQASAAAANDVLALDRGRIAVGLAADVIVFDLQAIQDRADFANPAAVSAGVEHVLVNGQVVLKDGEFTGAKPGRVLRGPGYRPDRAPHQVKAKETESGFASFDRHVQAFMQTHRVPGMAVAMTKDGKLVFSQGYGYADVAKQELVQPDSLFRIASISKPITAVAVMQLVQSDRLKLDDCLLDVLDLDDQIAAAGDAFDPLWRKITIRHLLQHRGGWDRDVSFDAMFQSVRFAQQMDVPAPADQATVIQAMLQQPLDFEPGQRYAYSNFGYCLLGRIIERISRQDYESYVHDHVLSPIGITNMRIGATRLTGRAVSEVRYYQPGTGVSVFQNDLGQEVPWPYGAWNLEAMDSHGGWIASAEDLARFAAELDDPNTCRLLNAASLEQMYVRPPGLAGFAEDGSEKEVYYSLGWLNRVLANGKVNHWHTGSLSGTAAVLIRRHDGVNLVALLNTRTSPTSSHLGKDVDQVLHAAANEVED
ncbi:MAG: serine hydrolase [Pirellulaceae bacterium]